MDGILSVPEEETIFVEEELQEDGAPDRMHISTVFLLLKAWRDERAVDADLMDTAMDVEKD